LVRGAVAATQPDPTFAWLVRFDGFRAWGGMLLFSGLVTIFGEELFFRGWLLQALLRRMGKGWAILLQATLFTLPQLLAAFMLAPVQGAVYAVVYSWLAVGMVGGWAAARTQSIWPSWVSATLWNLVMVAWVL
jgi:membrane protease YdiL (CAAX protease family)